MNFKAHRRNKSFLIAHTERQKFQRRQLELTEQPHPPNYSIFEQAKEAYYKLKKFNLAIQLFEQYLRSNPYDNEALYLCGVACLHISRSQEAIQRLKLVTKQSEHHSNAMLLTAIAYNKLGYVSKSFELINNCLRLYPQFEEALCFRGRLYMQSRKYTEAQVDFTAAVELPLSSFLSLMGLGDLYRIMNRFQNSVKVYQKAQKMMKNAGMQSKTPIFWQLQLKISICLYFLQDYDECLQKLYNLRLVETLKGSQLYYYLGLCEEKLHKREKALLSLEYCIKLQTNQDLVEKAYKRLLRMYLEDSQFYEAMNIIGLGQKYGVQLQHWKKIVEGFMLVIKNNYDDGLQLFKEIIPLFQNDKQSKYEIRKSSNQLAFLEIPNKIKPVRRPSKLMFNQSPKSVQKSSIKYNSLGRHGDSYSKSVSKALAKIGSVRNTKNMGRIPNEILRHRTQHFTSSIIKPISPRKNTESEYFNTKQKQLLYPLILKFKAYAEFFKGLYLQSMQTYDKYDNFVKDMFGRQSQLHYNKLLCEGMILLDEQLADEALAKFSQCVQYYFQKNKEVPIEPILYKLALLIKLAAVKLQEQDVSEQQDLDVASSSQIITSTLKMIENYRVAIFQHPLAYFYQALVYLMQEDYLLAKECLEKTLKMAEECRWSYLYVKGVVEMALENYYTAVKEFSAGLILEVRPELYLGRSISFFMLSQLSDSKLSEEDMNNLIRSVNISSDLTTQMHKMEISNEWKQKGKGQLLLQNCFSDLQSFIKLSQNAEAISIWVSRILFATKSFDEASSSMLKVDNCTSEFLQMSECIEIYEGQYQNGGSVGLIIKSAFDGTFLSLQEEGSLLQQKILKNYNNPAFQYLTKDYEKWLVILHLYVKQNYHLLLKYMQRQLFSVKHQINQLLLRYNICIVYLLMRQFSKANNIAKSLLKFQEKFNISSFVMKVMSCDFQKDECLQELKEDLGLGDKRLLSNSLPFRSVTLTNSQQQDIQVFVRINIPFPRFPLPHLELKIDKEFITKEVGPSIIDKKIDAPWVRRMNNHMIQFTENLEESKMESVDLSSSKNTQSQRLLSQSDIN